VPAEVVSADSAAVYRDLPVLTAAPPAPTRLVGFLGVEEEISVGEFAALAHAAVDEVVGDGRLAIVVGGTGLYFRAALAELEIPPAPEPGARERWAALYDEEGAEAAHALLAARDPAAAAHVHPNDRRRVVRALELAEAGSSLRPPESELWSPRYRRPTLVVGLDVPPGELDRRIEARAREMFERGVREEAQRAIARGPSTTAAKVMGLREAAELPRAEALDAIVRANRRLARYQRKWLRRIPGAVLVDATRSPEEVAADLEGLLAAV
jgi:tRNA dimethylallyltransferase